MKKILISIAAVALLALMIGSVYAIAVPPPVPPAPTCHCTTGFTPGFWKHNIEVRLGLTNGAYSAFGWANDYGNLAGVKLTDTMMDGLLADINLRLGTTYSFEELLAFLQGPGWSTDRTNTANQFNWQAGYGWY